MKNKTEQLITVDLPRVFEGSSDERWQAAMELRAKADELVRGGEGAVDENFIRELAAYNAGTEGLDFFAADNIFDAAQKPAGGSLMAMHAPSRRIWTGTGACLTTTEDGRIVHYTNRPGEVEDRYGPALPYVLDKLAWLAIATDVADHDNIYRGEGYQYVTNRLRRWRGISGVPHIGSIAVGRDDVYANYKYGGSDSSAPVLLASASGTLPTEYHGYMYEAHMPSLKERADQDRLAGLFDGYEKNKRAGLYDIAFGEMVAQALYGAQINDVCLSLFNVPECFDGVDIN
jgi:hypothetical protein